MKTLNKCAMYTDIHFGAHGNSEQHNKDCLDYLTWFCDQVKSDPSIDHIIFMGDYFEHRSSISGLTLDYAYRGAEMVNDIGLPVYFIVGNHDLFYRNNRDVHNTVTFSSLVNFKVINDITVFEELGPRGSVIAPFLFEHEFPNLLEYAKVYPVMFGHFEFKDFVITGDTIVKEHGPDHKLFKSFKRIFSGHYHKRQIKDNVVYIGNTFPTNFADTNDSQRGMATYDYSKNKLEFIDIVDAPSYVRCKLSGLMETPDSYLKPKAVVNCFVDIEISYEESLKLKASLIKKYQLRELTLDEGYDVALSSIGDEDDGVDTTDVDADMDGKTLDEIMADKLGTITTKNIDTKMLIELYRGLK